MRLSLSSAAAPDATLAELLAACGRRGLAGLELVVGSGHGASAIVEYDEPAAVRAAAGDVGVEICAIYRQTFIADDLEAAARVSAAVRAPVVVPVEGFDRTLLPATLEAFAEAGGQLLLAHGGDPRVVDALRWLLAPLPHSDVAGLAWQIRPGRDDPAKMPDVLDAAGDLLRYVRLFGGGPESQGQTGMGIGSLMARLTLAHYAGPLVLTPSTPSFHYVWNAWLGRAGGWGCGSKQSDPSLVTLERETYAVQET